MLRSVVEGVGGLGAQRLETGRSLPRKKNTANSRRRGALPGAPVALTAAPAKAPVAFTGLSEELRPRPPGVAPEAQHPAASPTDPNQVLGLHRYGSAVAQPDHPAARSRPKVQRHARLAIEVRARHEALQADRLSFLDVALSLVGPLSAAACDSERGVQLLVHRPALSPAAQHDAANDAIRVAWSANVVLQGDVVAPRILSSGTRSFGSDGILIHGACHRSGQVHRCDMILSAVRFAGAKDDSRRRPQPTQSAADVCGCHAFQGPFRSQLKLPRAQRDPPPLVTSGLQALQRRCVAVSELHDLVLLHFRDDVHAADPMAIVGQRPAAPVHVSSPSPPLALPMLLHSRRWHLKNAGICSCCCCSMAENAECAAMIHPFRRPQSINTPFLALQTAPFQPRTFFDQRSELRAREALHELVPRGRFVGEGGVAHIARVVTPVIFIERRVRRLRDQYGPLPASQTRHVHPLYEAAAVARRQQLADFRAFVAESAQLLGFGIIATRHLGSEAFSRYYKWGLHNKGWQVRRERRGNALGKAPQKAKDPRDVFAMVPSITVDHILSIL
eukprot:scaffold517_cov255-Pinguiococcus_pyrenoidosus.AAC.26